MSGEDIDTSVAPSGNGCADCLSGEGAGWWFHLRRCAACGHIGCCDSSPSQHATAHFRATGHPVIQSFEPGEDWYYSFPDDAMLRGPALAPPDAHPVDQPTPGPSGAVPANWQSLLN